MGANVAHIVVAGIALTALLTITLLSWSYRRQFISHYPQFSRSYDLITLGFSLAALAKVIFLPLDLNDAGFIHLEQSTESFLGAVGNLLLFIGLFPMIFGWAGMISSITRKYELVPVVEIEGEPEEMSPGVYITPLVRASTFCQSLLRAVLP